jgi:hypothetical protein
MKAQERSTTQENRRGFVRQCLGFGASLAAIPVANSQAVGSEKAQSSAGSIVPGMSEYERILSHTDCMHVLGNPRSWSLVAEGLHPFHPQRVVILPDHPYGIRCGSDLRAKIDAQIDVDYNLMVERNAEYIAKQRLIEEEVDPQKWFPSSKRESIYWMMDAMCGHYGVGVEYLEHWVVGLAQREILGSSAWLGMGLAHQYQRGGEVPVDNPPNDWWLFLSPDGYQWGSLDDEPIFANIAHVAQQPAYYDSLWPLWVLTQDVWGLGLDRCCAADWKQVAQMGRVDACRHLNKIAAQFLANLGPRLKR